MPRIKVLIVDDSAFSRRILRDLLQRAGFDVVGMARDGVEGVELALQLRPDVITLDVDMPQQDGLQTLKAIMQHCPTPVVMISARTQAAAPMTLACLEAGAVDCIAKLSGSQGLDLRDQEADLVARVRAAATARLRKQAGGARRAPAQEPVVRPIDRPMAIALGASTGGPRTVVDVVANLPKDLSAPVLYVQHMPAQFTPSYAARLNAVGPLPCKEAEDGEELMPGVIYLAPGDRHLTVAPPIRAGGHMRARLSLEPSHTLFRPSVDVLMTSVARMYGSGAIGVLMTGMGRDGAAGMKAIKLAGGHTIAESEETAVIFGMPAAAIEAGAAVEVVPCYDIPSAIARGMGR
jgi:two-component system chemotaxis response regulator CheB